ncbi:phosphonate ABC transporter, permease protein PhnE [Telmatospirillum sp. J64-1]|uniref:phosphonate ABC transporter, permease protein PhnE n=1 Tax=Telmatospirillum sp. J64-1 TaxID=2502183 RepID=UPI001C8F3C63|nr:phosphonate ABC transporter, permease protein PhnE [Telmatospirillum sp. J64-1]
MTPVSAPPNRFERPSALTFLFYVLALAFIVWSFNNVGVSIPRLVDGLPNIGRILGQMFPPDPSRLGPISLALLETFQMAVVGTALGVVISLPLAILASRSLSPHPIIQHATRSLISLFRTVPDLVWALFFVIAVGLGPVAGTLAIMLDTIGFCGRFFAESMEETDKGPREALTALGASRTGTVFSAVVPQAMPSFINTSLFSLEKATRSSVILGLVGAGGIGIELKVAMDLFLYDLAAAIIIAIFLLVLVVEHVSSWLRTKII